MSDLRKAFEKWALSTGKYMPKQFSRDPDSGRYTHVMLEVRWEAWQAALQSQTAPAVPEGGHSDYGHIPAHDKLWFAFDPEGDGATFHRTEADAKAYAETAIADSLDECWPEEVDSICYGRVVGAATQVNKVERPSSLDEDNCAEDGEYWPDGIDFKCDYELHPTAPQPDHSPDGGEAEACPRCKGTGQHVVGPVNFPRTTVCQLCKTTPAADGGEGEPADDSSTVYRIGDLGNQIHNLGCSQQNNEELADSLAELAHQAWLLQRDVMRDLTATHPAQPSVAVPEGWKLVPIEPTDDMRKKAGLSRGADFYTISKVWHAMLAAAPSPDHIADAGKVGPVGWIWETYGQRNFTAGTHHKNVLEADGLTLIPVYTHPAESREEIQAGALEAYADQLDAVFANAQKAGATDCPAWHAGQFAKDARKQAARLRTAGDEGEGV